MSEADMSKPVTFTTPSGDTMAVIPLDEYERLVGAAEEARDVAAYDAAKAGLARGEDELVPADVVRRLLSGENAVRVWREHRRLTGRELAERGGVSASYLSQLESGQRDGTLGTMKRIAEALGVTLDDLA